MNDSLTNYDPTAIRHFIVRACLNALDTFRILCQLSAIPQPKVFGDDCTVQDAIRRVIDFPASKVLEELLPLVIADDDRPHLDPASSTDALRTWATRVTAILEKEYPAAVPDRPWGFDFNEESKYTVELSDEAIDDLVQKGFAVRCDEGNPVADVTNISGTNNEEPGDKSVQAAEGPSAVITNADKYALAVTMRIREPDVSDAAIAKKVGLSAGQLSRHEPFRKAKETTVNASPPRANAI
ncbi:MAG TPA: hypothetical protein VF624_01360 [Tepidisphaeraceae bacterium]